MSYANSLSGNMASAARLVLATSSAASSTVRPWSWLMTDMTMFIITWSRRSLRRSSSCSCCSLLAGCDLPSSSRSDSPIGVSPSRTGSAHCWHGAFAGMAAQLQFRCSALPHRCAQWLWAASYTETRDLQPAICIESRGGTMAEAAKGNEKLVQVFGTEEESEAMVVRGLLESAGIDAIIKNREAPDVFPVGGVAVLVREDQAEDARQTIEAYRKNPTTDADEALSEEQG